MQLVAGKGVIIAPRSLAEAALVGMKNIAAGEKVVIEEGKLEVSFAISDGQPYSRYCLPGPQTGRESDQGLRWLGRPGAPQSFIKRW